MVRGAPYGNISRRDHPLRPRRRHHHRLRADGAIKSTLEYGFDDVVVRGEVSGLSRPRSGHIYLNLKDDGACLRSVLWRNAAQRLAFDLQDGLAVRVGPHLRLCPAGRLPARHRPDRARGDRCP